MLNKKHTHTKKKSIPACTFLISTTKSFKHIWRRGLGKCDHPGGHQTGSVKQGAKPISLHIFTHASVTLYRALIVKYISSINSNELKTLCNRNSLFTQSEAFFRSTNATKGGMFSFNLFLTIACTTKM